MENSIIKFKTNLQCGGCVSKVQADLDQLVGNGQWKVDTEHADKVLTLNSATVVEEVIERVRNKGFMIEQMDSLG
jgi:copper chaperone